MKPLVFVADLTHTANGISALTFPLGASYVASYAQEIMGDEIDFKLFKFPDDLSQAILHERPALVACSCYSWNVELTYKLVSWAKQQNPDLVVVWGGPNFPTTPQETSRFLMKRSAVDFYIQNEGEIGFVQLLEKLKQYNFDAGALKSNEERTINCRYLNGDKLIAGETQRIKDMNIIPSPYLTGIMDNFFDYPLVPLIETTRGCPFGCTFCADGLAFKNKVARYDDNRLDKELDYIAQRVKNVNELIIADLNFGMYKPDVETARSITKIQSKYNWPVLIHGAGGKNQPERVIETAKILKGSWVMGSSIQSSDEEVLSNIKRSNIPEVAYREFLSFMNGLDKDATTFTEIILALPGDSKEKHFESLRYGIESQVTSVRMYQAILLIGTEMASPNSRSDYNLLTKYRIIPGGVGEYQFGCDKVSVAEIEEIIVGSKDMSFDDYVSCRIMNLLVETYINGALTEEFFAALRAMDVSPFDVLLFLFDQQESFTPKMKETLKSFIEATRDDLYDSYEDIEKLVKNSDLFGRYLSGEMGTNELLSHRARLYLDLEDTLGVFVSALKKFLADKAVLNDQVVQYFDELSRFILRKKRDFHDFSSEETEEFNYDFAAIEALNYQVDPRTLPQADKDIQYRFFHTSAQKLHIENALKMYKHHPGGIGRMIQRGNLKTMYRHFERV